MLIQLLYSCIKVSLEAKFLLTHFSAFLISRGFGLIQRSLRPCGWNSPRPTPRWPRTSWLAPPTPPPPSRALGQRSLAETHVSTRQLDHPTVCLYIGLSVRPSGRLSVCASVPELIVLSFGVATSCGFEFLLL